MRLFRAEKLYTSKNYQIFLETFRNNFPDYVFHCPFRGKQVISAPLSSVKRVYVPRECLRSLTKLTGKDSLQNMTLDFIDLLSNESGIVLEDFGVHGSVALNMHTPKSDIDIVVYGAENFRRLEKTIDKLVKEGTLTYQSNNRLDAIRRFKGRYKDKIFMYNAIRKPEEIKTKYGLHKYTPLTQVKLSCTVRDDSEAMFRPATYIIKNCKASNTALELPKERIPKLVVSMIGCYRNVARKGDQIKISGMLERVENLETSEAFYQIVVGTGTNEDESICPL